MSLYWFWFVTPTLLSIAVTTWEVARYHSDNVQPKIGMAFFLFTGLPALIPGWIVFYAHVAEFLQEMLIPMTEAGTRIAEFTLIFVMFFILLMHIILVFPLIPVSLEKLIRNRQSRNKALNPTH